MKRPVLRACTRATAARATLPTQVRRSALVGLAVASAVTSTLTAAAAHAGHSTATIETAVAWKHAYNSWEANHDLPNRIVALEDHGTQNSVRFIELQLSTRTRRGLVESCGWLAVTARARQDPSHQIVAGGSELCSDLRGFA